MSRVVICGAVPFDAFIGRGRCPVTGEWSRWAIPASIALCSRTAVAAAYRVWLWGEIGAGRVDLAELASLHGKVFGVRRAPEGWHAPVLDAAAMWALAEQARRLEARLAEMNAERRRRVSRGVGDVR